MAYVAWLVGGLLWGVLVGYVAERERQYRLWGRLAIEVFTQPPMPTALPTFTDLQPPAWMEDA